MQVLMLGGTRFLGRHVAERPYERGDQVLVVHRGQNEPGDWIPVDHLRTERPRLVEHAPAVRAFDPDAV